MKKLEKIIESFADQKDQLEPEEGHFIRFREKLESTGQTSPRWIYRVAAVLLVAALFFANLYIFRIKPVNELPAELKETAYYYNLKSENILNQIESSKNMDASDKKIILNDLKGIEAEYKNILEDMKNFPGDERVVNAFIEYHRTRAAFLEEILNQLNVNNLITI